MKWSRLGKEAGREDKVPAANSGAAKGEKQDAHTECKEGRRDANSREKITAPDAGCQEAERSHRAAEAQVKNVRARQAQSRWGITGSNHKVFPILRMRGNPT